MTVVRCSRTYILKGTISRVEVLSQLLKRLNLEADLTEFVQKLVHKSSCVVISKNPLHSININKSNANNNNNNANNKNNNKNNNNHTTNNTDKKNISQRKSIKNIIGDSNSNNKNSLVKQNTIRSRISSADLYADGTIDEVKRGEIIEYGRHCVSVLSVIRYNMLIC